MRTILTLWALAFLASAAGADDLKTPLSSPMVDHAVYREGAIQRLSGRFGDWLVTCEQIAGLRQRYCSLRTSEQHTGDRRPSLVEVSTGDNGRPAALLHLPLKLSVDFGVLIDVAGSQVAAASDVATAKRGRGGPATGHKLNIVTCSDRECLAIWSLTEHEIRSLTTGSGVTMTVCSPGPAPLEFATDLKHESCALKSSGLLSAVGFGDAVQASIR